MAGTGTETGTGLAPSLSHNPRGSLLELAYKLQMAHQRVFGFGLEKGHHQQFHHHQRHHQGLLSPTTLLNIKTEPGDSQQHTPSRPYYVHPPRWEKANDGFAGATQTGHSPTFFAPSVMTLAHIKTESEAELGYNAGGPLGDADNETDTLKSTAVIHTSEEFRGPFVLKTEGEDSEPSKNTSFEAEEEDDCGGVGSGVDDDQSFQDGTLTINTRSTGGVPRRYQCPACDYQTDNKSHFTRHETGVHSLIKPYYCPVCQVEFSRTEKARAHMLKRHPGVRYDARIVKRDQPASVASKRNISPGRAVLTDSPPQKLARGKGRTRSGSGQDLGAGFEMACGKSPDQTVSVRTSAKSKSKEKRFVCSNSDCSYRARDIWHLRRHVADVHNRIKSYKCPVCTYATSRKHRLVSHMKAHGRLYCFHCKFSTNNVKKFNLHVQICSLVVRNENLRCKRCGQGFVNRRNMKDHASKKHNVTLYCCDLCMFWSESQDEYESHHHQHTKSASDNDRAPKPTVSLWESKSGKPRAKQPEFIQPKVKTEPGEEISDSVYSKDGEGVLHCSFCKHQTKGRSEMRQHLHKHCEEKITCEVPKCSFRTSWQHSMDLHVMAFHAATDEECDRGRGQFPCPYCPDKAPFVYKKSFDKHVYKHKEAATKCPLCKEAFIMPAELKLHLVGVHHVDDSDGEEVDEN